MSIVDFPISTGQENGVEGIIVTFSRKLENHINTLVVFNKWTIASNEHQKHLRIHLGRKISFNHQIERTLCQSTKSAMLSEGSEV